MKDSQARMLGLTTELIGLIVVSIYLGKYLDKLFNSDSLALLLLLFGSFILWVAHVLWLKRQDQSTND